MKTVALLIFIAVYVLLLLLPNYRAISALAAAAVFVLLGIVPLGEIAGAVDWNVLLMLAGTMVPFQLIPALLARPDAERGTWRRFLTSPGVLCFGALSLSLALSYLI